MALAADANPRFRLLTEPPVIGSAAAASLEISLRRPLIGIVIIVNVVVVHSSTATDTADVITVVTSSWYSWHGLSSSTALFSLPVC